MFLTFVLLQITLSINSETVEPIYVKGSAIDDSGTGTKESPVKTLNTAYTKFDGKDSDAVYTIKIIKTADPQPAESITFDKQIGVKVVGVAIKEADNSEDEAEVELNCKIEATDDLIKCRKTVELSKISFIFPFSLASAETTDTLSLIAAEDDSNLLKITSCKFKRPDVIPADSMAKIHLVNVKAGELQMSDVQCSDEENMIMFTVTPFLIEGVTSVNLASLDLQMMGSLPSAVIKVVGKNNDALSISLDSCQFSTVVSAEGLSGALHVESVNERSTFTVKNTNPTNFVGCTTPTGKAGAIFLQMTSLESADKLSWPQTENNLQFVYCAVGDETKLTMTALYLDVPVSLHAAIATAMKASFAHSYVRTTNKNYIMAKKTENEDEDIVSKYIDPAPKDVKTVYVKSGATGGEGTDSKPWANIKEAYDHLTEASEDGYCIEIMKADEQVAALVAEVNTFDKATLVTIEGYLDNVQSEMVVEVNCASGKGTEGKDLFTCKKAVAFKKLKMTFPLSFEKKGTAMSNDGTLALIHADSESTSLTIDTCIFSPSTDIKDSDEVKIHLVRMSAGTLTMNMVGCPNVLEDEFGAVLFSKSPFLIESVSAVSLTLLDIEKLTSKESAVVKIVGKADTAVKVVLDGCSFASCSSSDESTATSGALFVECENKGSTFTVKETYPTSFVSCNCAKGKSGALYLKMTNIEKADQLKWPKTENNFKFTECTAGKGDSEKSTGIYLDVPVALHEEIAIEMKDGFATGYERGTNDWNIVANSEDGDVDFTSKYFDPAIAYVKKDGSDEKGETYETPMGSIKAAYDKLITKKSISGYMIKIIKEEDAEKILKAEAVTFEKEVTIVGVNQVKDESTKTTKEVEEEVTLDCDAKNGGNLFTCKKKVEFRSVSFLYPLSLYPIDPPASLNDEPEIYSLIVVDGADAKLIVANCKFVRPEPVAPTNDVVAAMIQIANVKAGELEMRDVKCTDEKNEACFLKPLFEVNGASSVKLDTVEINKVIVMDGAAVSIQDATDKAMKVEIEGLTMNGVTSQSGFTAGILMKMVDGDSIVEMGKEKKCTFKSCVAAEGKAGAIFIEVKKAVDHLKLPAEGNLDIDSTNKGKDSSVASLCIIAEDFENFCKQENAFGFAKNYNNDNKGWIVGAKDEKSDLEDVYEKYLKKEESEPEKKKMSAGTIVAIVVPIVVVVIVVVVVIIVIVVVRKKRSRN
ncbi:uncharacterized protein MONOS_14495 [Monocercomonoides exilis]|uniref:uncharacterized protein n=1 Tax=Monocercomonoides exilis TaxID=2049356 RepID=UPI00355A32E0|nr:hypothetical protein MONOS_14495 [Monocercomonoides exilis]|eukprot:MONOS_14495.1-p1 / transcript=MONOS_14495.1 / gene=MONOS_14495 / organism=Monocercomonoides_exilis_PA203 / gene_product=unspecified product / transcript_product=unspecified product / location=Mono_scaffold01012:11422-15042(-) / protein_length=1207 / sequence_SO=supercontig / SO=protein_coding / is_pseudo=false